MAKARKKSAKKSTKRCPGLKANGKLKKGFTWRGAAGGCPKKAAKKARKRSRKH
jgi:hypothetical protein